MKTNIKYYLFFLTTLLILLYIEFGIVHSFSYDNRKEVKFLIPVPYIEAKEHWNIFLGRYPYKSSTLVKEDEYHAFKYICDIERGEFLPSAEDINRWCEKIKLGKL